MINRPTKLFVVLSTLALTLTSCSLTSEPPPTNPQHKVTYQIIRNNNNKTISADTIKTELENRLRSLGSKSSQVTVDGDHILATIDLAEFDRAKALDLATTKQVTIQEPRTAFSSSEADQVQKYNQYQRDVVKKAHDRAMNQPQNIDDLVVENSDESDLINQGRHGPIDQGAINEPQIWKALLQTSVDSITPIVELPYAVWFSKVTDIRDEGGMKIFYYQQISRDLKETGPYLNYMPVANLSNHITKVAVVKKNPDDIYNIKDYTVRATLDEYGRQIVRELSTNQRNKPLRLFIDDFPYTNIMFKQEWTGTDLVLDDDYTELNVKDIIDRLNQNSLSAPLSLIAFE